MNNDIALEFIQPIKKTIDWAHIKLTPLEESDADLLYVWGFAFRYKEKRLKNG